MAATLRRGDGIALGSIFEMVAYRMTIRDGVRVGALVPFRGLAAQMPVSFAGVPLAGEGSP